MFMTKIAQMPPNDRKFWGNISYQNGDKNNFSRRCPGVSDDVSTQVCLQIVVIYDIHDNTNLSFPDSCNFSRHNLQKIDLGAKDC